MSKVYVFLANGFEEIEGLTVVDLLRRAGVETVTVSITGENVIHGAHGIDVFADTLFEKETYADGDMLVLPGGMPGTKYLGAHEGLKKLMHSYMEQGKRLCAICAAPSVLGQNGFLQGKRATSYPGFEEELKGAICVTDPVAVDGNIITSRGMGTAIDFSLAIISVLVGSGKAEELSRSIQYR